MRDKLCKYWRKKYDNEKEFVECLEDFESKFKKNDVGCWIWYQDHLNFLFRYENKWLTAYRLSYRFFKGKIPEGLYVLHSCDIPTCVNPEHLRVGTNQDNMNDMTSRNRQNKGDKHWTSLKPENILRGHDNANAKLTEEDVIEIRKLFETGMYGHTAISRMFGVLRPCIRDVVTRRTWKHIK